MSSKRSTSPWVRIPAESTKGGDPVLVPHKADPNYEAEMERHRKDPSSWGGMPGATAEKQTTQQPQVKSKKQ